MKTRILLFLLFLFCYKGFAQTPLYAPSIADAKSQANSASPGQLIVLVDALGPAQFRVMTSKPSYAVEDNFWFISTSGSKWLQRVADSTQAIAVYDSSLVKNSPASLLRFDGSEWVARTGDKASNGGTILRVNAARYWERKLVNRTLDIRSFPGVVSSVNVSGTDVSGFFQTAVDYLNSIGGGTLYVGAWEDTTRYYLFKYPVFIPSNVNVVGDGKATRILANISASEGRVALMVGDSREWNRAMTALNRKKGWFTSIQTEAFTDIPLGEGRFITRNDPRIVSRNVQIRNLYIKFDYTGKGSLWGGYGIQLGQAADCLVENIWTENATQAFGVGSDSGDLTPACVNITVRNIHVVKPDPVHTYYAIGFVSNSNNCLVENCDSPVKMTAGTPNGTLVAVSVVSDVVIRGITGSVGRTVTSQGVFINNAQNCTVESCVIDDAKDAVAAFFNNATPSWISPLRGNTFRNVTATNSDNLINTCSKYDRFENIQGRGYVNSISFLNVNGTDNTFIDVPKDKILPPPDQDATWPAIYNTMPDEFVTVTGSIPAAQINDFNLITGGFEGGTTATLNAPTASSSHFLNQTYYNTNFVVQEARTTGAADTRIFERKKIGGVWSAWREKNKNKYISVGDSAYTVPYPQISLLLGTITANRVLTLPAANENNRGFYYFYNRNTSASFNWTTDLSFTTQDGTAETLLRSNDVTILENTGVSYRRVSPDAFSRTASDARYALKATSQSIRGVTSSYTITLNADRTIIANATAGGFTITLPALSGAYDATTLSGREYIIKKADTTTNVITLQASGSDLIETAGSMTISGNQVIRVQAYPGRWVTL
ncbi:pyocin knob domain-containing protein [Siphonobacter aquaeclarae]|uniref:Right handed beta helix region n=1 Tax=Siphonobacter aquaeclarae TaxID=563176 RepID=A0A1G9K9L1_9BACT|nr:pyocin knob domain-containing protein [Siphonobacter aquaeclarae]SDL46322.1 hypothetical protein SAMN04488090_0932 [Siphonobacter aquaeclarae]